jgi:hypothetical protein
MSLKASVGRFRPRLTGGGPQPRSCWPLSVRLSAQRNLRPDQTSRRPARMIRMTSRKLAGGVWSSDVVCGETEAMAR